MRDENGKFVKGSSGNPKGRPPKEREERYYEILLTAVTYETWEKIVRKAAEQAARGDQAARKWLADYIVGQPTQNVKTDNVQRIVVERRIVDPTASPETSGDSQ